MGTYAKIELIEDNKTYEIDCTTDGHIETVGVHFLALASYDIKMLVKYLKLISINGLKIYGGLEPYIGDNVQTDTCNPIGAFKLSDKGSTFEVNKDIYSPLGLTSINFNDLKINKPKRDNNFDYYDRAYVLNLDTKQILIYDNEGKIALTCNLTFLNLQDSRDTPMGVTMFIQDLNNLGILKEVRKAYNNLMDINPIDKFEIFFLNSLMIFNNAYTKYEVLKQLNMVEQGIVLGMIEKPDPSTSYVKNTNNRILNNDKIAKFLGLDDWSNPLFEIPFKSDAARKNSFTAVEIDCILHTITDEGEPNNRILNELQFKGISL